MARFLSRFSQTLGHSHWSTLTSLSQTSRALPVFTTNAAFFTHGMRLSPAVMLGPSGDGWQRRFAGHNKWSQIKRDKAVNDGKRGATFTRLALTITSSVKESGADPTANARLAAALNEAKVANMPKATIEKAIKRGQGETGEKLSFELYQGYGPHNVALMIEAMTDNPTRTVQYIRSILNRAGGSISSVEWLFDKKGQIHFTRGETSDSPEVLMDRAIEAGAEDIQELDDNAIEIICAYQELQAICARLTKDYGYHITLAEINFIAHTKVSLGVEESAAFEEVLDRLDDIDEVVKIHCNAE
ncbi:hypothetical protein H4R33_002643 [Dimargaris cristalligena]|uniref:Transcriptional regulator-domain-containing protein n=1 Tax=Dimargaris cristalligena TaxID=215637 RepID=A0A4P9ZZX4_9FUNG|nr:hypothetical protein H4R33_002643 [Dimargaris cristalligena]RKP38370.1 transcriptional regulator-domain-containing protein [Dimargaris cristalligena]|eukprot:RKP38370.1 transcriptional regulator-domain-containing protein [Dimargaris cristalligena]